MSLLAFIERMYSKKYNSRKSKEEDLREYKEISGEVSVRKIRRRYQWSDTNLTNKHY